MRKVATRTVSFLGSLRLATILLVLITLAAVVGGVLPQAPITPNADEIYRSYGVFCYRIITRLSLDDVFHNSWFLGITALFALNLSLCTASRARGSIARTFRRPRYVVIPEGDETTHQIAIEATGDNLVPLMRKLLRQAGFRRIDQVIVPADRPSRTQLVGRRWHLGSLGPDLVHVGILVILAGALLGVFRQEGTLIVNEWEKGTRIPACTDDAASDCIPLIYDLRVDDFGVEIYEDSARVKTYWANLTFLDGDKPVVQDRISVNRPLTIGGFGFHPWRYGDDIEAAVVRLHVMESEYNAVTSEIELRIGETIVVPGTQLWLTALRFYRTFALTDDGQPTDLGNVPGGHSAVLLQITGVDETGTTVAYRDLALPFIPQSDVTLSHTFVFADAFVPAFLEIHYARNPGYPIVWWGFVLVMVGLAGAFYFTPSLIRVEIHPDRVLLRAEERSVTRRSAKRLEEIAATIRLHCNEKEG